MSTMEDHPEAPPQLTHEDRALLAVQRVETLATEALNHHSNSKTMDAHANWNHDSWKTSINHEESGHKVGEIEVTRRGLIDKPKLVGTYLTRTIGTGSEASIVGRYWIDPKGETLFEFTGAGQSAKESDNLSKCNPITTKEVMDQFADLIEGALHPEKKASKERLHEIADASSPTKSKRRGGFLMKLSSLSRRVFDPSKVFPKKRS